VALTRADLEAGRIHERVRQDPAAFGPALTPQELEASLADMLARKPDAHADSWVFGYGSLMWNPLIEVAERRIGRIRGYHRRYCLWSTMGRGTPDCPGLMLGMAPGGQCTGVAYRLDPAIAERELLLVWRREMVGGAYKALWLPVRTDQGTVHAIAFVINPLHPRSTGRLDDATIAAAIARASGQLGSCADYLFSTVQHLAELGLSDRGLSRIASQVRAAQAATAPR
jgi:cation transport protein ChaC